MKAKFATFLPTKLEDIATYYQNMFAKMEKIRDILKQPSNRKHLQSIATKLKSYRPPLRIQVKPTFEPKSVDEYKYFRGLLKAVKEIVKDRPKRKCFISYAWPKDKPAKEQLQVDLKKMKDDLEEAGVEVMLDTVDMRGDIDRYMIGEILSCDKVLLVSFDFIYFLLSFFFLLFTDRYSSTRQKSR